MNLRVALLLLAVLFVTPEPRYFRYQRAINSPGNAPLQAGQTCLAIDPQIYAHAAAGLSDLRLYAGNSGASPTEHPYVVQHVAGAEIAPQPIALLNKGTLRDSRGEQTVFDAEMPAGAYRELVLDVSSQNFIATVHVSGDRGSDTHAKTDAETDLGSYTIFDFTAQRLGRSTVLHLPESNLSHLHFRVDGALARGDFNSLSVTSFAVVPPMYQTVLETQGVSSDSRASVVRFEVPAHTPIDRIAFTPSANPALFSRDVSVAATADAKDTADSSRRNYREQSMYSGTLLRIHTQRNGHKIDEERLSVDLPNAEFDVPTKWTITIQNGDDPPLSLKSVRLEMLERKLCFDAAAGTAYTLLYGDSALSAPNYDYARLFVAESNSQIVSLGAEQLNPGLESRPDARPFTERHPVLLWATLIGVVALLAGIAFQSIAKLKTQL